MKLLNHIVEACVIRSPLAVALSHYSRKRNYSYCVPCSDQIEMVNALSSGPMKFADCSAKSAFIGGIACPSNGLMTISRACGACQRS